MICGHRLKIVALAVFLQINIGASISAQTEQITRQEIPYIINDDAKWLSIMRGLNADFRHQTVTREQIETYISNKAGVDLNKIFDQYLRTTNIPLLKYKVAGKSLSFNYERVVKGFAMPLRVSINGKEMVITPKEVGQTIDLPEEIKTFEVNRNFYIKVKSF